MSIKNGTYVIVRGTDSGVFFGKLEERDGREVFLRECRRLWYWEGAASISQIAVDGTVKPENCKFTMVVDSILLLDAIEVIPCTEKAVTKIKAVPEWKM